MRALLSGYYGQGNGGDEALLATLLQMLPSSVTPVVLSGNPEETQERYGVEACERKAFNTVMQALRSCDAFIWGGGSLIQDATSAISPFYYSGLMAIAQKRGIKTVAWAQGIGPLKRNATKWLARQNYIGCTGVSVRDSVSAALLREWEVNHVLAPDPVWALESRSVPGIWDTPAPRVAVTLRAHPELTPQRLGNLTKALVDFQKATETYILLIPFQKSKDLAIAQAIQPALKDVSQIITEEDPIVLKGLYRGVEMTIGMRLHSLIMAASEGSRCFALSYDPKINRLMEEIEIPGWDIDKLPDDANVMSTAWMDYFANGEALSDDKIKFLTDRALIHKEVLQKALT